MCIGLGVYHRQEADASLYHNVAYVQTKECVLEPSMRSSFSRRGRRRPRVRMAPNVDENSSHGIGEQPERSTGFESPYIPVHEQSAFGGYQTPSQIPAFGVSFPFADELVNAHSEMTIF